VSGFLAAVRELPCGVRGCGGLAWDGEGFLCTATVPVSIEETAYVVFHGCIYRGSNSIHNSTDTSPPPQGQAG